MDDAIERSYLNDTEAWRHAKWKELHEWAQRAPETQQQTATVRIRATLPDLESLWSERLFKRRPFQYITGGAHWRNYVVAVGEGVLIPRPETEQIIDFADEALKLRPQLAELPWADLGCGSGALTVGLAHLLGSKLSPGSNASVYGVDVSSTAVMYSKYNAERLGVSHSVQIRQGSWCKPLKDLQGKLGGLVSNPPYIAACEMDGLQAEVAKHEPHLALHGGAGIGMDSLIEVIACARRLLKNDGYLALETAGGQQAEEVAALLSRTDGSGCAFMDVRIRQDYYRKHRFVTGTKYNLE